MGRNTGSKRVFRSGTGRHNGKAGRRRQPVQFSPSFLLDALEGRTLLSTYTVTTTADSGAGSLRQAINDANASADPSNLITFNLAGGGMHTISVNSALPAVTGTVTIDGTDPADRTVIAGNGDDGIVLNGFANDAVIGNYIGLDADGNQLRNNNNGMSIYGATGFMVRGNVISGNNADGIYVNGAVNAGG